MKNQTLTPEYICKFVKSEGFDILKKLLGLTDYRHQFSNFTFERFNKLYVPDPNRGYKDRHIQYHFECSITLEGMEVRDGELYLCFNIVGIKEPTGTKEYLSKPFDIHTCFQYNIDNLELDSHIADVDTLAIMKVLFSGKSFTNILNHIEDILVKEVELVPNTTNL